MHCKNTADQYGLVAISLHWLIAVAILTMLALGFIAEDMAKSTLKSVLFSIHKSLGLTILLLMLFRLYWRIINPSLEYPQNMPNIQKVFAIWLHRFLYLVVFLIIPVGWIMSAYGGHKTYFWWWFNATFPVGTNDALEELGGTLHLVLAWVLIGLLTFHIAGALWHHYIKKDSILKRMMGG